MERHQTTVQEGEGKEPVFNEDFVFDVKYIGDDFHMRILSKNTMVSDGLIGQATIKVSALTHPDFDDWFKV